MGAAVSCLGRPNLSESEEDPFQNTVILGELFRNLSFQDLKQCRLVNRLWKELATPLLTKKCRPLNVSGIERVEQMNAWISCSPTETFTCSTRFILDCPIATLPATFPVLTFLEKVCPWVTELHLGGSVFQNEEVQPREELFRSMWMKLSFPCLKTFGITVPHGNRPVDQRRQTLGSLPQLYQQLDGALVAEQLQHIYFLELVALVLEKAPLLKHVHLTSMDNWEYFSLFLLYINQYKNRIRITQFKWVGRPGSRCVLPLALLRMYSDKQLLELSSLELNLGYGDNVTDLTDMLVVLLTSLQDTLHTLRLKSRDMPHSVFETLPPLPKVTTLEVNDTVVGIGTLLSPVERFPALRSLTVATWSVFDVHRGWEISPVETVEHLELLQGIPVFPEAFLKMSLLFPRLKKLSAPLLKGMVKGICKVPWPCLEQLTLVLGDLTPATSHWKCDLSNSSCRKLLKLKKLSCLDLRGCVGHQLFKVSQRMIRRMRKKFTVLL